MLLLVITYPDQSLYLYHVKFNEAIIDTDLSALINGASFSNSAFFIWGTSFVLSSNMLIVDAFLFLTVDGDASELATLAFAIFCK